MRVAPGIHQLRVPIPISPLGFINAYLVQTPEGCLLVDTGWNTQEAFDALAEQLSGAGVGWDDLRYIVITHAHPDHYGLVGRLVQHTRAKLVIHEIEKSFLAPRYLESEKLLAEMEHWLRMNGVPDDPRPEMSRASMEVLGLVAVAMPDMIVYGGEHIRLGDFDLEILWTPGHSAGHVCLYERERRILFSGDHVLPKTTPNVSMHVQTVGNPLADYLNALSRVASLPVDLVLPAHGDMFTDLRKRVAEIEKHHEQRKREMLDALASGPRTAYQVASVISWSTGGVPWEQLSPFLRRMAVTETLAHLELFFAQGSLTKVLGEGRVYYVLAPETN
jgi:glyoxylase-like metal-dependent hydrolase (beta-lactamase superfamily II)